MSLFDDLAEWNLHCYCPDATRTPHSIVRMDDNGKILKAAVGGITRAELTSRGLSPAMSQLRLLEEYRLLSVRGDRLTTTFPVLDAGLIAVLRSTAVTHGGHIAAEIVEEAAAVSSLLESEGMRSSAYAVLFGYCLDGLLWYELARRGILPDTALTLERPRWAGLFWASFPEQHQFPGTNTVSAGDLSLITVWTERTLAELNRHAADPSLVARARSWAVPLLTGEGRIDELCAAIAGRVATELDDRLAPAASAIPGTDRVGGTVILAHELIWAVIGELVARGVCALPTALRESGEAEPLSEAAIAELLVFTRVARP